MLRIDAHQHFWKFDPARDSWITEDMNVIRRDFLPADLLPILQRNNIAGSVVVQSDQSLDETAFQLNNAAENDFIKGVVGWVDLSAADVNDQLASLSGNKKLKGFRHILQGEADDSFMLRPDFKRGIGYLRNYDFTYDILVYPKHLFFVKELVTEFPDQPFVIDHLAKPYIKDGLIDQWEKDMLAIAACENVSCKISGMVTEADWTSWKKEDFRPYLDIVFDLFGSKRIMFGSDWPVCLLAGSYEKMLEIVEEYISEFTEQEQADFWGGNATSFYHLT